MGGVFKSTSSFMTGAAPFDPIASKVGEKVDPLYKYHQRITALSHDGTEWDTSSSLNQSQQQMSGGTGVSQNRKRATLEPSPYVSVASKSLLGQ